MVMGKDMACRHELRFGTTCRKFMKEKKNLSVACKSFESRPKFKLPQLKVGTQAPKHSDRGRVYFARNRIITTRKRSL